MVLAYGLSGGNASLGRDTKRHVLVITRNGMRHEKFCNFGRSNHRIVLSVGTWTDQ